MKKLAEVAKIFEENNTVCGYFGSGANGNQKGTSNYSIEHDNGTVHHYRKQMCHAGLLRARVELRTACTFYTACQLRLEEMYDTYLRWVAYIGGPNSPWRDLRPTLHYDEKKRPLFWTVEINDETSAQLLQSFAIASRHTYEKAEMLRAWEFFQNNGGYSPAEALYLAQHILIDATGRWVNNPAPGAHYPFDYARAPIDVVKIRNCTPTLHGAKVRDGNETSFITAIWAKNVSFTKLEQRDGAGRYWSVQGLPDTTMHNIRNPFLDWLDNQEPYTGKYPKVFLARTGQREKPMFQDGSLKSGVAGLKIIKEKQPEWDREYQG